MKNLSRFLFTVGRHGRWVWGLAALVGAGLAMQGCATAPPPAAPAVPPAGAAPPAAPQPQRLAVERRWLQSWFEGTPVRITQQAGGAVSVDVPLEFSFDAGRSQVKPPLAAVLDKVAQSLMRTPKARLDTLAAPGDGADGTALGQQRARQVRSHLLSRGVPAAQLGSPTVATAAAVQMRMALVAP